MRKIEKWIIAFYFAMCPAEIALHLLITSTAKYVGLMIVLVEGCIVLSRGRRNMVNLSSCSISTILWIAYCMITLSWGQSNEMTKEYLTTYALMGILLIACTLETWEEKDIQLFLYSYLLGSALMGITVLLFRGGNYADRETIIIMGRECDPNQVAANIVPGAVIAFHLFVSNTSKRFFSGLYLISASLCVYTIFLTGSRGGFASLAIGIIAELFILMKKGKLKLWIFILLVALGIAGAFLIPELSTGRVLDFDSYNDTYANKLNRVIIWKTLLKSFDEQWIIGHGIGSTINYFREVMGKLMAVHNTFLHVLYEVGIVGFGLFIFPYIKLLIRYFNKNVVFFSVLIGALICSFFLDALNLRYLWNGLILCIMRFNLDLQNEQNGINENRQCKYIRYS